jgi:hypothetical protein
VLQQALFKLSSILGQTEELLLQLTAEFVGEQIALLLPMFEQSANRTVV